MNGYGWILAKALGLDKSVVEYNFDPKKEKSCDSRAIIFLLKTRV